MNLECLLMWNKMKQLNYFKLKINKVQLKLV